MKVARTIRLRPPWPVFAVVGGAAFLCCPSAWGEAPARRANVGLALGWLQPFHVSGGIGTYHASAEIFTLAAQPYGEWQASEWFAMGLGVPVVLNAPGVSSNAYGFGLVPRLRLGYSVRGWLYPYALAEAGPAWSSQHKDAWLSGVIASTGVGARVALGSSLSTFLEVTFDYTTFSGDMPLYYATSGPPAPILHGHVATSYLRLASGLEFDF
ncbi:MAG TPA: hypothetical protein VGI10_25565 [Polyangiaceae bacterium]